MNSKVLQTLIEGKDLDEITCEKIFAEALEGRLSDVFLSSFLTGLKIKGESSQEIYAGAKILREQAMNMNIDGKGMLDTCGTGGDGVGTFNVSTGAAFICAAAGARVAKHGNRSVSSKCGSFDVLEALGCEINLNAGQVKKCIQKTNIGFMYAPLFHRAMKNVAPVRKSLGFRTIFNVMGPLSNPAGADHQIMGVYSRELMPIMISVLAKFGLKRALVVHGDDGMDEITITGDTSVIELNGDVITKYKINPEMYGLKCAAISDVLGDDADYNAKILTDIFKGRETGAKKDLLVLNAGAALYTAGISQSIKGGIDKAVKVITAGAANRKLNEYIAFSKKITGGKV